MRPRRIASVVRRRVLLTAVEFEINELLLMTGGTDHDEVASTLGQFVVTTAQSNQGHAATPSSQPPG